MLRIDQRREGEGREEVGEESREEREERRGEEGGEDRIEAIN